MDTKTSPLLPPVPLESGAKLPVRMEYSIAGSPAEHGSNVIFVCPPLTANSHVTNWWRRLFGAGAYFDRHEHAVVCVSPLGSAYGSTGPWTSTDDAPPLGHEFPQLTVRDIATANLHLMRHLGYRQIYALIGASFGGSVALEMALLDTRVCNRLLLFACAAEQSQYRAAHNETQRMILELDSTWSNNTPDAGKTGLGIARASAILSYRPYSAYFRQQHGRDPLSGRHKAVTYQHHKGNELAKRFNAISYHRLLAASDSHDVGRNRGGVIPALKAVRARTNIFSLSGDPVYDLAEQRILSSNISGAALSLVDTDFGHDGFLIESAQIADVLSRYHV